MFALPLTNVHILQQLSKFKIDPLRFLSVMQMQMQMSKKRKRSDLDTLGIQKDCLALTAVLRTIMLPELVKMVEESVAPVLRFEVPSSPALVLSTNRLTVTAKFDTNRDQLWHGLTGDRPLREVASQTDTSICWKLFFYQKPRVNDLPGCGLVVPL